MQEDEKKFEEKIEEKLEKKFGCNCNDCNTNNKNSSKCGNDCIYGMGIIGAAIFFISNATSFWVGVLGVLKALVWPAILVYELLNLLMK